MCGGVPARELLPPPTRSPPPFNSSEEFHQRGSECTGNDFYTALTALVNETGVGLLLNSEAQLWGRSLPRYAGNRYAKGLVVRVDKCWKNVHP